MATGSRPRKLADRGNTERRKHLAAGTQTIRSA